MIKGYMKACELNSDWSVTDLCTIRPMKCLHHYFCTVFLVRYEHLAYLDCGSFSSLHTCRFISVDNGSRGLHNWLIWTGNSYLPCCCEVHFCSLGTLMGSTCRSEVQVPAVTHSNIIGQGNHSALLRSSPHLSVLLDKATDWAKLGKLSFVSHMQRIW